MNENLIRTQDILLEKLNSLCRDFGLNNVMAQLYTILYFSHKPLSLNDMLERLKISKGSVSVNIRALERYGVVRRIWVKGSRKDYYEAETDIAKVVIDRIRAMSQRRMSEFNEMMESVYKGLELSPVSGSGKDDEAAKVFKQRMGSLRKLQTKAQTVFDLLNSGLVNSFLNTKAKNNRKKEAVTQNIF